MRPLRVAIVAPSLDILGGQSVQADLLIRAWRRDPDVEAWLVPINPSFPAPIRWARRVKYLRTITNQSTYLPSLFRSLRSADLVHVFSASYASFFLAPVPAVAVAKMLRRPVILNYHSGQAPDHLRRSPATRWVLARVDRNVVPSEFLVDVFSRFGLSATAVPNIVALERFTYRERPVLAPRILTVRSFEDLYNVGCTIRAFRLVQNRFPDASLTLAGGGSREPALRALVGELQLRHVRFAGRIAPDAIAELYAAHDIYLQSPDIDNMPLSILEAFASGLPVVTTDVGGIPYMVSHRINGLMAPAGDHQALADHVLELIAKPELAMKLTRAAASNREAFSWQSVRRQWLDVYRDVLARAEAADGDRSGVGPVAAGVQARERQP